VPQRVFRPRQPVYIKAENLARRQDKKGMDRVNLIVEIVAAAAGQ
jgi:hypothetical protein